MATAPRASVWREAVPFGVGVSGSSISGDGMFGTTVGSTINTAGVVGWAGGTSGFSGIAGVWGDSQTHVGLYGHKLASRRRRRDEEVRRRRTGHQRIELRRAGN